jgi:uncharacterized protein (TIGR03435 family)
MTAYDVKGYQISGPAWLASERYDIAAKVPAGATQEQVDVMWQNLLLERFGLRLHHESKEFKVEELVVAKGGPKLKETAQDPTAPLPPGPPDFKDGQLRSPGFVTTILVNGHAHAFAKAQPLSKLTEMLGNTLHLPVLDKTGLAGKYDFEVEFRLDLNGLQLPVPPPRTVGGWNRSASRRERQRSGAGSGRRSRAATWLEAGGKQGDAGCVGHRQGGKGSHRQLIGPPSMARDRLHAAPAGI